MLDHREMLRNDETTNSRHYLRGCGHIGPVSPVKYLVQGLGSTTQCRHYIAKLAIPEHPGIYLSTLVVLDDDERRQAMKAQAGEPIRDNTINEVQLRPHRKDYRADARSY
jgi:hypothetical protein